MEEGGDNSKKPIEKKILHAGKGPPLDIVDGTKVKFHFITKDENGRVLDDSRSWEKPMELIIGKKFKLEAWELCVRTMKLSEVASFKVEKSHTFNYPAVAKTLRDTFGPNRHEKKQHTHTCSMMAMQVDGGLGYDDLNELLKCPVPLEFIIELLGVESPEEYEKESWQLDPEEKIDSVGKLRETGNGLFKEKKYKEAAEKYAEALGRLEQLILREKPHEPEWDDLRMKKVPLLLNYSQCKLYAKEYYPVIEHCTEALEIDPGNVKALFRRAKGHVGAWNPGLAKADFNRVSELDPSLLKACRKEIGEIEAAERKKDEEDKQRLQNLF